jgi:transposase
VKHLARLANSGSVAGGSRGQERLERENQRLQRENERLRKQLDQKQNQLIEKQKRLSEAEKQITDLERQLGWRRQNSTTSSKPPSSDGLAGPQRERGRKKKSCRRPGGQPGHRGRWRGLASADRVNEVVTLFPPRCRHCERQLPATGKGLESQGGIR